MDILTLKSKVKLRCIRCEKCCKYRGDIRLIPYNACKISKYLGIPIKEFIKQYTDRLENNKLELVLKTIKTEKQCILYDEKIKGCSIHKVKPMQCVMFPLIPENLKRDYFYNSNQCILNDVKEITVNEWVNGNNKIYSRNKKIYLEWIRFIEWAQEKLNILTNINSDELDKLYKILFEDYNLNKWNLKSQMRKNMFKVERFIINKYKNQ